MGGKGRRKESAGVRRGGPARRNPRKKSKPAHVRAKPPTPDDRDDVATVQTPGAALGRARSLETPHWEFRARPGRAPNARPPRRSRGRSRRRGGTRPCAEPPGDPNAPGPSPEHPTASTKSWTVQMPGAAPSRAWIPRVPPDRRYGVLLATSSHPRALTETEVPVTAPGSNETGPSHHGKVAHHERDLFYDLHHPFATPPSFPIPFSSNVSVLSLYFLHFSSPLTPLPLSSLPPSLLPFLSSFSLNSTIIG